MIVAADSIRHANGTITKPAPASTVRVFHVRIEI